MLFKKRQDTTDSIKALETILNKFVELKTEISEIKVRLEALEQKYNSLRASMSARKRWDKEVEKLQGLPPEILEQLGYQVVKLNRNQSKNREEQPTESR